MIDLDLDVRVRRIYHCGRFVEEYTQVELLCGAAEPAGQYSWDPVHEWITGNFAQGDTVCPDCLAHPDLPLALLGEL